MQEAPPTDSRGLSLLLVEDHELTRRLLREWLGRAFPGLCVLEAESGEAAIGLAELRAPDVAVVDIRLPGINGIETTRRLRACVPAARIAILTNHELAHYQAAAAAAGACAYVLKRTMHTELLPVLRRLLLVGSTAR